MQHEKSYGLLRFLTTGLLMHSRQDTIAQLGDRTVYIGMSDIGKAMECLRGAVADKAGVANQIEHHDIAKLDNETVQQLLIRQITLQRGHWQEFGVENAIKATGALCVPQLEINFNYKGIPVKAHLDFTIVKGGSRPVVRILELKSNARIPDHLHVSYEAQVYGQVGLLHYCWDKPIFSLPSSIHTEGVSNLTFPEVINHLFKVQLPSVAERVDIEAWVLSIAMSDIKPFGPYKYDEVALETCLNRAEQIWSKKEQLLAGEISLNDIEHCKGFHPLCDFCDHNAVCPKFEGRFLGDEHGYDQVLDDLVKIKKQEAALKEKRQEIERSFKGAYRKIGDNDWLSTKKYRFKVVRIPGRKSFDSDRLHENLSNHLGDVSVEEVLKNCQKSSLPHERLYISKINNSQKQVA